MSDPEATRRWWRTSSRRICSSTWTVPLARSLLEVAASSGLGAAAEDDAADDVDSADAGYAAATSSSRSAAAGAAIACSLSCPRAQRAVFLRLVPRKDAEDSVAEASNRVRGSWWPLHSDYNSLRPRAMPPASVHQVNLRYLVAAVAPAGPRSTTRAN